MKSHFGYTLVELLAAATILGVVAAASTPTIESLEYAAKKAKIDSTIANVKNNLQLAHGVWLANGKPRPGGYSKINIGSSNITYNAGWPTEKAIMHIAGISCKQYGCYFKENKIVITASIPPQNGDPCFFYRSGAPYELSNRLTWDDENARCQ